MHNTLIRFKKNNNKKKQNRSAKQLQQLYHTWREYTLHQHGQRGKQKNTANRDLEKKIQ